MGKSIQNEEEAGFVWTLVLVLDHDFVMSPFQKRLEFGPKGNCNLLKVIFAKAKVQKSL
jgi:hypothetical protein